jgi:hypothetical protein
MKLAFLVCLLAAPLVAQQGPLVPDCFVTVTALTSASVNSSNFDNRLGPNTPGLGCQDWTVTYYSTGFSGISVELDSSNDSAGTPTGFGAFAGTLINGTNPNTTLNEGSQQLTGYFPWIRLRISGLIGAGTATAFAFGYRPIAFFIQKSSGPAAANISQLGGSNIFACPSQAVITLSGSGNTSIITHSGTNRTLICFLQIAYASAVNVQVTSGTGSNCAAGTANVTGLFQNVGTITMPPGPFSPLVVAAGQDTCINDSAVVNGGGIVMYVQTP